MKCCDLRSLILTSVATIFKDMKKVVALRNTRIDNVKRVFSRCREFWLILDYQDMALDVAAGYLLTKADKLPSCCCVALGFSCCIVL